MRLLVVIFGLLVVLAAGAGSAVPAPTMPPPSNRVVFTATADAYVTTSARKRNFGRKASLLVRGHPAARAYMTFDLRGVTGTITRASLSVYALNPSPRGIIVRTTSPRWSERKITFANAPRAGKTVGGSGAFLAKGFTPINFTRALRPGAINSFVLSSPDHPGLRIASRESTGARSPSLVLEQRSARLLAAGDIADCDPTHGGDEQTAELLDRLPGTVVPLGDLAYEDGTAEQFADCYAPTWGRAYARTRPTPGNHEYQTPGAAGYFGYWGSIARDPAKGYYSYDLGPWHVISLNSNCDFISGCGAGSPEEKWLRADLSAHPARCTLAYWHHPRFSGGAVGGDAMMQPIWQALYEKNADLVLTAHAHDYQRFAPMTASGNLDTKRGIREFVIGTGGHDHQPAAAVTNTEVINDTTFGVLSLRLRASAYDWTFVPVAGGTFTDSGSTACH
jgi:hypothetical protein